MEIVNVDDVALLQRARRRNLRRTISGEQNLAIRAACGLATCMPKRFGRRGLRHEEPLYVVFLVLQPCLWKAIIDWQDVASFCIHGACVHLCRG